MKKTLIFCIIVIIAAGLSGFSVHAHYYEPVKVEIETEITLGGLVTIIPDTDCPVPPKTELNLKRGEIGVFSLGFTKAGVYSYTVKTLPDNRNLKFDTTVYRVKIYVTDEDGTLSAVMIVARGSEKYGADSSRLMFVNTEPESSPVPKTKDNTDIKTFFSLAMLVSAGLLILSGRPEKKNV